MANINSGSNSTKHHGATGLDKPEAENALRAAAQAKGSPLSDAERAAVYASLEG